MKRVLAAGLAALLSAAPLAAPAAAGPDGLYVGYYQEDPASNPEDPTPGSIYLSLPAGDNAFAGSMFFTYVGCQTSNVGLVSGRKTGSHRLPSEL